MFVTVFYKTLWTTGRPNTSLPPPFRGDCGPPTSPIPLYVPNTLTVYRGVQRGLPPSQSVFAAAVAVAGVCQGEASNGTHTSFRRLFKLPPTDTGRSGRSISHTDRGMVVSVWGEYGRRTGRRRLRWLSRRVCTAHVVPEDGVELAHSVGAYIGAQIGA